jgi:hypothetical protein
MLHSDKYSIFTRAITTKYILNSKDTFIDTDDYVDHCVRPTDHIDFDSIDDTLYPKHVRRLPRSVIINNNQKEDVPFDIKSTRACRVSLVDPEQTATHVQDKVFFYEVVTYLHKSYVAQPLEPYKDVIRVRDITKIPRRPVDIDYSDYTDDECYSPPYKHGWVDQHRRDLTKYQPGKGILCIPISKQEIFSRYTHPRPTQAINLTGAYRPVTFFNYELVRSEYSTAHTIVLRRNEGEESYQPHSSTAPYFIFLGCTHPRGIKRERGDEPITIRFVSTTPRTSSTETSENSFQ